MKKVVLILLGLVLLCCCCSVVAYGLIGHLELNGQCVYRGPLNSYPTGACANTTNNVNPPAPTPTPVPTSNETEYDGRNSDEYTFIFPKKFFLDDSSSIIYVYSQDPDTNLAGQFNDNLNITSASDSFTATRNNCESYSEDVVAQIGTTLNIVQSTIGSRIETINNESICMVSWNGSINGIDFSQEQYLFPNDANDEIYIVTVSLKDKSTNNEVFRNIVNSFDVK